MNKITRESKLSKEKNDVMPITRREQERYTYIVHSSN